MRFPDFLLIGAMKCGTTTVFSDLQRSSEVFFPTDKEPNNLSFDKVLTEEGREEYSRLFSKATQGQLCGDASTMYSMNPLFSGAPERALELCGTNLKIVYVVRDPVLRIFSHYFHWRASGRIGVELEQAIFDIPNLIDFSKYRSQLAFWRRRFPDDSLSVVWLDNWNDSQARSKIRQFLGLRSPIGLHGAKNTKSQPKSLLPFGRFLSGNRFYRRVIRPAIPPSVRLNAVYMLGKKTERVQMTCDRETIVWLLSQLKEDFNDFAADFDLPVKLNSADFYLNFLDRKYGLEQ